MMFPTYLSYLFFILLLSTIECLVQLSSELGNLPTEVILRETINKLFSSLKLNNTNTINSESRSNQYLALHKYFMSVSLQDLNKRLEVKNISKVENLNNITANYVSTINDVLNEGNDETIGSDFTSSNVTSDNDVILIIQHFLKKLEHLKKEYAFENTYYVNINTDVLKHLRNLEPVDTTNKILNISFQSNVLPEGNEFWEPSGRRVYKGKMTKIRRFPFMASIQIFNSFSCAGSIISSDLIITACSCLQLAWNNRFFRENPMFLSVRIGSTFHKVGGEVIPVLEIYFHPGYTPKSLKDNVCILRLVSHIIFNRRNRNVKKIIFDKNESSLPLNTDSITIVGWGATTSSGILSPWRNKLKFSVLDIYPLEECRDIYSRKYVTRKNFCAGFMSKGGGACNKDAGGPGISGGKLMGVISFGPSVCGTPDIPTVFTKLGYYADWIEEIMDQRVPVTKVPINLKPDSFSYELFYPLTTQSVSQTYKMQPITTRTYTETTPLTDRDALRIVKEDLFHDFLSTMFSKKEIDEGLFKIADHTSKVPENIINFSNEGVTAVIADNDEIAGPKTIMIESEIDEVTASNNPIIDEEFKTAVDEKLLNDKELSQIIDSLDLEKIIQQEVIGTDKEIKLTDDPVFYLYDSEEENNKNDGYVEEENNTKDGYEEKENDNDYGSVEGMKIAASNNNNDFTSKRKANSILPDAELFNVLSEAIQEQIQKKT